MSQKEFTIREYKDSDLQGVLSLWEHHSGWGRPETKEYEKWMQTPYGDCVVLVAEHQKEVTSKGGRPPQNFDFHKKKSGEWAKKTG